MDQNERASDASAEPTDVSAEPTDASAEPTDASAEPPDASAEPTDASAEPTDASAEPTDASAEPTDASGSSADGCAVLQKGSGFERFHLRKLVSLTLLLLFLAAAASGLLLFFAPAHGAGRGFAELGGWRIHQWAAFHARSTIAFGAGCLVHLVLNARTLWCYLRGLRVGGGTGWRLPISRELLVALPLALVVVAGAAWCPPSADRAGNGRGRGHAWRHDRNAADVAPRAAAEREPCRGAEGLLAGRAGRGMRGARAGRPRR